MFNSGAKMNTNAALTSRRFIRYLRDSNDSDDSDDSTFCEPHTNTFVTVSPGNPNVAVRGLLEGALESVQRSIDRGDHGPIPTAGWRQLGRNAVSILVISEAQHQTTYEILHSALQALQTWMHRRGRTWSLCSFSIWNGANMVGQGTISGPIFPLLDTT